MGRLSFLAGLYSCSWMVTNDPGVTLPPHRGRISVTQRYPGAAVVGTPAPGYRWPSYTGMYHGTCVAHMPWCMSGSLTRGGGENVSGIPGACATRNFSYLVRGPLGLVELPMITVENRGPIQYKDVLTV